jgi:hypothetical protein
MTHRTLDDFYTNLEEQLSQTLREAPFRYYTTGDGAVECGHLLHPGGQSDTYQNVSPIDSLRDGMSTELTKVHLHSAAIVPSPTSNMAMDRLR